MEKREKAINLLPPDYGEIPNTDLMELRGYLLNLGRSFFDTQYLDGLFRHFDIMGSYFRQLLRRDSFRDLVSQASGYQKKEDMEKFLGVLVYVHDFGRLIIPPKSLDFRIFDGLSEELLADFLILIYDEKGAAKIKSCLHSVDWIIGEEKLAESDDQLPPQQRLALILKAVDTIGKNSFDERGGLVFRHPDIFFDEDGDYQKWLEDQKANRRFPIKTPLGELPAEEYAKRDKELTLRGVNLIKRILVEDSVEVKGEEFDALWVQVQQEFAKLYPKLIK